MAADPPTPVLESPLPTADNAPTVTSIRRTTDGSIDEDVYCLGCGYNLRGLSGDPVTCPECGKPNPTGDLIIPAAAITLALRRMETAPTTCVGMSILALFSLFVAVICILNGMSLIVPIVFIVGSTALGITALRHMRIQFGARPGWLRVLFDFHLVTAIVLICAWLTLGSLLVSALVIGLIMCLLGVAGIILASSIYGASRRRLAFIQREAAVRMAKEILRTHLRHGK